MIENFGLTGGLKGDFYPQLRSGSGESVESEPLTNKADWADPGNIPTQPLHTQTLHHLSAYSIAWLNILVGNSHLEFYFIFRTKS